VHRTTHGKFDPGFINNLRKQPLPNKSLLYFLIQQYLEVRCIEVMGMETIDGILVVTTETVPGYRIVEVKGLARGGTVKATHLGRDIMAVLRNIKGGEVKEYTQMMAEAREEALRRMALSAKELGANAVVNMRFATSNVGSSVAEVYAYGTAVVIEKEE